MSPFTPIVRDGRAAPVRVMARADMAVIDATLRHNGLPEDLIAVDLGLGTWRGHDAARQLSAQLGLDAPTDGDAMSGMAQTGPGGRANYAALLGLAIDSEAQGNATIRRALLHADRIAAVLRDGGARTLLVVAPADGGDWQDDTLWLLRFLAAGLGETKTVAVVVTDDPLPPGLAGARLAPPPDGGEGRSVSPSPCLGALVPGLVAPEDWARLGGPPDGLRPLAGGCALVKPEWRARAREMDAFDHDELAAACDERGWLKAYAQVRGNNYHVDRAFLQAQAWAAMGEGGGVVALRFFDRARGCAATAVERAAIVMQAQGVRISLHRFADAAAIDIPPGGIDPALDWFLYQTKGWGLAMTGRGAEARALLEKALDLLDAPPDAPERLYLMNILALACVRSGDVPGALELELDIEARCRASGTVDRRLVFVNALNLARLYREVGDLARSRSLYEAAFETDSGAHSATTLIYTNFCLAKLAEAAGDLQAARRHAVRSALHFAACPVPEALAPRHVATLIGGRPGPADDVPSRVAEALCAALSPYVDGDPPPDGPAPVFLPAGDALAAGARAVCAVGVAGWSVIAAAAPARPARDDDANRRLRGLLSALLVPALPVDAGLAGMVFLVDDGDGREMAADRPALLDTCRRLQVDRLVFEGEETRLDAAARAALSGDGRLCLGPLVDDVETAADGSVLVRYARHLPPRRLDDPLGLIRAASAKDGLAVRDLPADAAGVIRDFERARVLVVIPPALPPIGGDPQP